MAKNSTKKKKKININFNFSDDDSGDEFLQSGVLKPITINNRVNDYVGKDNQNDSTIVSGDFLRRKSQLPSFLEDIGPPVMDSTHIAISDMSNHTRLSVSTDNIKENIPTIQKSKKSLFSNSFLRSQEFSDSPNPENSESFVEVQDGSMQTSAMFCESNSSKIVQHAPSSKVDNESVPNASILCEHSSSSSSNSHPNLFSTALDVINTSDFTKSEVCSESPHSSPTMPKKDTTLTDSNSLSQEQSLSSYYVKDASLQTSLSQNSCNATAPEKNADRANSNSLNSSSNLISSLASHQVLKDQKQIVETQKFPTIIGNYRTQNSLCDIFGRESPNIDSPMCVLAADSDEELNSMKTDEDISNNAVIVADSEDDDQIPDNLLKKNNELIEVSGISPNNSLDRAEETANLDGQGDLSKNGEMSDLQDSDALCLRWSVTQEDVSKHSQAVGASEEVDQVTASLESLSFHQGQSTSSRRRLDSSSSEDDNFDDYLKKLKGVPESKKSVERDSVPSMEDFIDDDNSLSNDGDSEAEEDDGDANGEDGHLFYIQTDNERNRRDIKVRRRPVEKTYIYHSSSCSESDSDLSGFIVDDDNQSQNARQDLSQDGREDKEDNGGNLGEAVDVGDPVSGGVKNGGTKPKSKTVVPTRPADTPLTGKTKAFKDAEKPSFTSSKKKLLASSFTPAWSSDSDDDFMVNEIGSRTPSRFKPASPGPMTFKTPRPVSKSKASLFETPVSKKGPLTHPWTAPKVLKPPSKTSPNEDNTYFLKSLSENYPDYKRHPEAARFVKNFKSMKEELTQRLFRVFNETVFDSKIPSSIGLVWNVRYRKTAGTFSYKRSDPKAAKITLSVKVCDRPERVRDTLVHELCHAAVRIINEVNESHGPVWKSWARKVNAAFPFMPVVARCHDYIIHSKYTYQCVNCKYRILRHSKSLDTERKVCGHCKGEFQVFLTSELNASSSSNNGSASATPKTPRTPNRFAMFVKECYSEVKKRNVDFKHGDIMKELSKEFAEKNKIQA